MELDRYLQFNDTEQRVLRQSLVLEKDVLGRLETLNREGATAELQYLSQRNKVQEVQGKLEETQVDRLRQQAILQILRRRQVSTQEELVELLRKKGFEVTQSSVSRDLRQLGIAKLGQEYRPVDDEVEPEASRDLTLSAEFVREVRTAGPNITAFRCVIPFDPWQARSWAPR